MADSFTLIPILDYSYSQSHATKLKFLSDFRSALVKVGFLQIINSPLPIQLQQDALRLSAQFFNLPTDEKLEIENIHSKHLLRYSKINSESTAAQTDHNVSILMGHDLPSLGPNEPIYLNLQGLNQWPKESSVPGFREVFKTYYSQIQDFSVEFTALVAEALEMPKATLTTLLGQSTSNVSRLKATRYLPPFVNASAQDGSHGIGPHKDGSFMTYLLGKYNCLEVQNKSGDWIPVPPVPGALVVNIGRLLEIITQGVWVATTHRVVLRTEAFLDDEGKPLGPRFSIPFFQFVNLLLMLEELTVDIPAHIKALGPDKIVASDAETFYSGLFDNCIGDNVFVNHITTFPKVGEKWYPHLLRQAREKQAESKRRISRYGRPIDAASDRRPFLVDQ